VKGSALNYGTLLGAGTVRNAVMKYARKKPTPDELAKMCDLVRAGMKAGAFGLSTGPHLRPGQLRARRGADRALQGVHELGGLYVSHMRSEERRCRGDRRGTRDRQGLRVPGPTSRT
jgi:N-acyl-D-aspartate/D-glutamate deacylase